jgi:DNA-binding transcriptional regulator GbsR (MarR family)
MSHSTGVSDSYYRATEEELLSDYLKAVSSLTITEEHRLKEEVAVLSAKLEGDGALKARFEEDSKKIEQLLKRQAQYENLLQSLIDSGILKPADANDCSTVKVHEPIVAGEQEASNGV